MQPTSTIASVKQEVLSALVSDVNQTGDTPNIASENDFELCRALKEKGKAVDKYELLDPSNQIKTSNIANWEYIFIQFRDEKSGKLLPVTYSPTNVDYDDEETSSQVPMDIEPSTSSKGKRKAPPE